MKIREANESDNEQLLGLQSKSPMGRDLIIHLDSSPDFFNRSKGYKDWNILVAEDKGTILGAAGYAVQAKPLAGKTYQMVYEYGFMVDPEARRMGIASNLQSEIEERNPDADFLHLNITEDNQASHGFFTKKGFKAVKNCGPFMLMAYKEEKVDTYKVKQVREGDLPVVVELLNETYADYELYTPFTEESLTAYIDRLPFFSLSDLYIYEQDTILAVAGFWDYDKVMKFTMLGFNTRWWLMRLFTNFVGRFTSMPYMPGVGEQMTNGYLMLLGYRDPEAASNLIAHIMNHARGQGVGMVSLNIDKGSHVTETLSRFRHGVGSFNWYMKPLNGNLLPEIDGKMIFVDPLDV